MYGFNGPINHSTMGSLSHCYVWWKTCSLYVFHPSTPIALIFKVDVCFQMSLSQRTKTLGTLGILWISRRHPSIEWTRNTSECAKRTAVVLVPDLNPSTTSTAPNKDHMCLVYDLMTWGEGEVSSPTPVLPGGETQETRWVCLCGTGPVSGLFRAGLMPLLPSK